MTSPAPTSLSAMATLTLHDDDSNVTADNDNNVSAKHAIDSEQTPPQAAHSTKPPIPKQLENDPNGDREEGGAHIFSKADKGQAAHDVTMKNLTVAQSIPPPMPEVQAMREDKSRSVKELEKTMEGNNTTPYIDATNNEDCMDVTIEEYPSSNSEVGVELNNNVIDHNQNDHSNEDESKPAPSRNFNSTILYDGSVARVELASPPTDFPDEWADNRSQAIEIPDAYLVESTTSDRRAEITVLAEPMQPWYKRRWGRALILVIVVLLLGMVLMLLQQIRNDEKSADPLNNSSTPIDTRPTLEIVRERDVVRCGLGNYFGTTPGVDAGFIRYSREWVSGVLCFAYINIVY